MRKTVFSILFLVLLMAQGCQNKHKTPSDYKPVSKQEVETVVNKNKNISDQQKKRLQELIDLLQDHPKSAKLYAERAQLFVELNEIAPALRDISMAVDLDPDNPDYHMNKAQLLRQFKRNKEALEELNKALELDPHHLGALFNRGALYFNTKKYKLALKDFSACIQSRPDVAPPYFNRAFTYEQLHDFEHARADLKKFISLTKNEKWKKLAQDKLDEWDKVQYKHVVTPDEAARMGINPEGMGFHKTK